MQQQQIAAELQEIRQLLAEQSPRPFTLAEAAEYLSISKSRIYHLTSKSLIGHSKPGGKKIYFQKADLDAYASQNRIQAREELAEGG